MFTSLRLLACLAILHGLFLSALRANESDATKAMLARVAADLDRCTAELSQTPGSVRLYSQRGDCHLFLGHFAEAVRDFEKMIALDPAQDAPHWRLGIAYHFVGDFAK